MDQIRISFFLLLFIFYLPKFYGQSETNLEYLEPSALSVGSTLSIIDPNFGTPNSESENPAVEVSVGIEDDIIINPTRWFKSLIKLKIWVFDFYGTEIYSTSEEFYVEYSPFGNQGNFNDLDVRRLEGAHSVEILVQSISTIDQSDGSDLGALNPGNIFLQLKYSENRYRRLSTVIPTLNHSYIIVNDTDESVGDEDSGNELEIYWDEITGAEFYDLQWSWIDNFPEDIGSVELPANQILFTAKDFSYSNSHVRTSDTSYRIPLIYADGYLIYRVRAVGFRADDYNDDFNFENTSRLFYGQWTNGNTDTENYISDWNYAKTTNHDNGNKNWQFQASFAENGKKKEVVSYFDGTLRNRQTVTKINTDNTAIVGEVIYDNQGRPGIEVLPTPAQNPALKFHKDFNRNMQEEIYTHYDFDWSVANQLDCSVQLAEGMHINHGASLYYSQNTDLKTETKDYFVPDAKLFPFSQVQYLNDNTGRIKRKSGVGLDHQLGSGHEMKYFYGITNQPELNRLFGYKVGYSKFYKKNTVFDPNGQISVSYIDPQGRTIATALSGDEPTNMIPIYDSSMVAQFDFDLLDKDDPLDPDDIYDKNFRFSTGSFSSFTDGLFYLGNQIVAEDDSNFELTYTADINYQTFCDDNYFFVYNLDINISDECGNPVLLDNSSQAELINHQIGQYDISSSTTVTTVNPVNWITDGLPIGNYTIDKQISINEDVFYDYLEHYMNSDCILPPEYFDLNLLYDFCDMDILCQEHENYTDENDFAGLELQAIRDNFSLNGYPPLTLDQEAAYTEALIVIYTTIEETCADIEVSELPVDDAGTNTFNSNCSIALRRLKQDFSPGEQYAIFEDTDGNFITNDNFSIYYEGANPFLPNTTSLPVWKNPVDLSGPTPQAGRYLDEVGNEALVKVYPQQDSAGNFIMEDVGGGEMHYIFEPDMDYDDFSTFIDGMGLVDYRTTEGLPNVNAEGFFYVYPEHLTAESFKDEYQDSWADALLFYHPEIGYTTFFNAICIELISTGFTIGSNPTQLSSTAYDDFLNSLTFDASNPDGTLITGNAELDDILVDEFFFMNHDPFFNSTAYNNLFTNSYSAADDFNFVNPHDLSNISITDESEFRIELMRYAMEFDIDNLGIPIWKQAYRLLRCGDVTLFECNIPTTPTEVFDELNTEERELYLRVYRSTYLSMKEKIVYLMSSIYAGQNGFFNGCIENLNNNPSSVISDYPVGFVNAFNFYFSEPSADHEPGVCESGNHAAFIDKWRRFLPYDHSYTDGSSGVVDGNDLMEDADFGMLTLTGHCPKVFDMTIFLNGLFQDSMDGLITQTDAQNEIQNVQYLTADLYIGMGGTVDLISTPNQPLTGTNGIDIYTFIPSGPNKLQIFVEDDDDTNCSITIQDNYSGPSPPYDWDSYGTGAGQWHIVNIKELRHEETLTDGTQDFSFIAEIVVVGDTAPPREVVFNGNSCVNLGNCGDDGSQAGNSDYDYVHNNSPVCNERYIGLTILAPDSDQSPYTRTTYSILDQGHRHDIAAGVVTFLNNISQPDNLTIHSFLDAQNVEYVVRGGAVNTTFSLDLSYLPQPKSAPNRFDIQNDDYLNTFITMTDNIPEFITSPLDIMYIVLTADKYNDLEAIKVSYNQFVNHPLINKVFFIILDTEEETFQNELTPYKFMSQLIIGTPVEYNGITNSVHNSHYAKFNISQMTGSHIYNNESGITHSFPELANILTNTYNEYFDEVGGTPSTNPCNPCIPATPITVSCTDEWAVYQTTLGVQGYIPGVDVSDYDWMDEEAFCETGAKYSLQHYLDYVASIMGTSGTDSPYYISFSAFSTHALGAGHPQTGIAIQAYATYISLLPSGETGISWLEFAAQYVIEEDICPVTYIPVNTPTIPTNEDCEETLLDIADTYSNDLYEQYLQEQREYFRDTYLNAAMDKLVETLNIKYDDKEYQYTLYYYDQAGNLIQTVPPKGVDRLVLAPTDQTQIQAIRDTNGSSTEANVSPDHQLRTRYKYNSLNQLVYQKTPDGGETRFAYDDLGRIVLSQNANQLLPISESYEETITALTYVNPVGVDISGNNIVRNDDVSTIGFNCGVSSDNLIYTNGHIEWVLTNEQASKGVMVGLSYEDNGPTDTDIDYRFFQSATSNELFIRTSGGYDNFVGTWQEGDILKIRRQNGVMQFWWNGSNIQSFPAFNSSLPLRFDCSLQQEGSTVFNPILVNTSKAMERYSYTSYDDQGRIDEAGQLKVPINYYHIDDEGRFIFDFDGNPVIEVNDPIFPNNFSDLREEVTMTLYDRPFSNDVTDLFENYNEFNNRNRVTSVLYYNNFPVDDFDFDNGLFYNYDIHGNVKEFVTFINDPILVMMDQHLKSVKYDYDLISGNVLQVAYQEGKPDQFLHKYNYDADNRILDVHTSTDGIIWEKEAKYDYYKHGPLARVLIGDKKVQGMDYAYTLQGWLKGVNSEKLDAEDDIGNDAYYGGHAKVAKDAMAFTLRYFDGDYDSNYVERIHNLHTPSIANQPAISPANLYNGNIKQMTISLREIEEKKMTSLSNSYLYDQLNRISSSSNESVEENNSLNSFQVNNAGYNTSYQYDRNGNLERLGRSAFGNLMDNFVYDYNDDTNQLNHVQDLQNDATLFEQDIDNQSTNNYIYDEIGQLIVDDAEELSIDWTVSGKVSRITKDNGEIIRFKYDGLGNRLAKIQDNTGKGGGQLSTTYYLRDAQGNPLAVNELYNSVPLFSLNGSANYLQAEHQIYGSSRLGLQKYEKFILGNLTYSLDDLTLRLSDETQNLNTFCDDCGYYFNLSVFNPALIPDNGINITFGNTSSYTFDTTLKMMEYTNPVRTIYTIQDSDNSSTRNWIQLKMEKVGTGSDFYYRPIIVLYEHVPNGNPDEFTSTITTFTLNNTTNIPLNNVRQEIFYTIDVTGSNLFDIDLNFNNTNYIATNNISTDFDVQTQTITNNQLLLPSGSILSAANYEMCYLTYNINGVLRDFQFSNIGENPFYQGISMNLSYHDESLWIEGACALGDDDDFDTVLNVDELDEDTDMDGTPNYLDPDDDGDGILTIAENYNGGSPLNDFSDSDDLPDYLDPDDDGDGIPTAQEQPGLDAIPGYPLNPLNTDGDQLPNYRDPDDDGDTVLTIDEYDNNADFDNDTVPNYLDTDDDDDGVPTSSENTFDINPYDGVDVYLLDTDEDGFPNYIDIDDDGDGYITSEEDADGTGPITPMDTDTDGDGYPDFLDPENSDPSVPGNIETLTYQRVVGDKRYELNNHLGNVLSVITDRKLPVSQQGKTWFGSDTFATNWAKCKDTDVTMASANVMEISYYDKVSCAFGLYSLEAGGVYILQLDIDRDNFTADLRMKIVDENGNVYYDEYINSSGTHGTQFIAAITGNYEIQLYIQTGFTAVQSIFVSNFNLADVSGVAIATNDFDLYNNFLPDVFAFNDYYPFGSPVPGRHGSVDSYRYGFQGQERDDEVKGPGNSINYKYRMHDPRVGRFFAPDPMVKEFPWYSPYIFSGNTPIMSVESEGLYPIVIGGKIVGYVVESGQGPTQIAEDINNPETQKIYGYTLQKQVAWEEVVRQNYTYYKNAGRWGESDIYDIDNPVWNDLDSNIRDELIFAENTQTTQKTVSKPISNDLIGNPLAADDYFTRNTKKKNFDDFFSKKSGFNISDGDSSGSGIGGSESGRNSQQLFDFKGWLGVVMSTGGRAGNHGKHQPIEVEGVLDEDYNSSLVTFESQNGIGGRQLFRVRIYNYQDEKKSEKDSAAIMNEQEKRDQIHSVLIDSILIIRHGDENN